VRSDLCLAKGTGNDGGGVGMAWEGPWKSFKMPSLSSFGTGDCAEVGGTTAAGEDEGGVADTGGGRLVDFAASDPPFWTATEPKDLTTSAGLIGGAAAGEEEIGATGSYIELKVIGDPR